MIINLEEIKKVAKLCKFNITEEEAALYSKQLSSVLGWVEDLQKVDTSSAENTLQEAKTPLRADNAEQSPLAGDIVKAFNDKQENLLKVKKVL